MSTSTRRPITVSRLKFLATPRWIALEIAVVAFAAACYFLLAPWQFNRSAEHDAQVKEIAAAVAMAPAPVDQLLSTTAQPAAGMRWRQATATGRFDPSGTGYIRLRHDNDGQPAYEVVVPFVTPSGTVLVDRGYVPFISVQNGAALPALPTGTVTVTGRVQPDEVDPKHRPAVAAPDGHLQYTAASSAIAAAGDAPGPVYRGYLQLVDKSPGVIEPIALPSEDGSDDGTRPYFSYAIQWLSFGAIAIAGLGYFIYREYTDPVADEDIYLPDDAAGTDSDATDTGAADAGTAETSAAGDATGTVGAATSAAGEANSAPARDDRRAERPRRRRFDKSQLYDER